MATYNQLIYNLKNLYRGGLTSDDESISNRQLMFIFNTYRAKLVREDLNKKRTIDRQLIQDLGCIKMICVDAAECCEIDDSGAKVLRSKEPIPKFLELYDKTLLTFVGTVDRQNPFQISTETKSRWSKYNKYTSKSTRAYLKLFNDDIYLYVTNAPKGLELINVQGIFEDPEKASKFSHCNGEPCFSYDGEYPISAHMIPIINQLIMQNELKGLVTTPTDETNNTTEDAGQ